VGTVEPGRVIAGRYEIIRLIGEGGMGAVYEARHVSIGRRLAVKVLNAKYSKDADALKRFQQEAKIAGTLGHLNVCEVMDFGTTHEGLSFLVMEYLEGENLGDMLRRERRIPPDVALGMMDQILGAIEEVHRRGIVHRDLKPQNAFVTNVKGHGMVVKLLDFGISKVLEPTTSMKITGTGAAIGTPYYMSPEQIQDSKRIDGRADLYACATMLYEMITGRVPHTGTTFSEILANILTRPSPDPRAIVPDLRDDIVDLIRRGMQKDPARRFESAAQFRQAIKKIQVEIGDGKLSDFISTDLASTVDAAQLPMVDSTRRKLKTVGLVALVLVLAAAGLTLVFTTVIPRFSRKPAPALSAVKTRPLAETSPKVQAGIGESAGESKPESVEIELKNAPEGVKIIHEGRAVAGPAISLVRDSNALVLTLEADGYKSRTLEVTPLDNAVVDGTMEPLRKGKAEKKEKSGSPEDEKKAIEKAPVKETKKKEGMELDWEGYPGGG